MDSNASLLTSENIMGRTLHQRVPLKGKYALHVGRVQILLAAAGLALALVLVRALS
jgi:hypothetical protein